MITNETKTKIAKYLKIEPKDLEAALTAETEVDLELPELNVFTAEELTTRDGNQKSLGYKEGKGAAIEMLVKEQKEKLGLDFEGKDPEKLIESFKNKVLSDAKVEPNKKIEEKDSIIAHLQNSINEFKHKEQDLLGQVEATKTDSMLLGLFPTNRLDMLQDSEYLTMIKGKFSFEKEDGKMVVKENGETLRDKTTQNPIEPKTAIQELFTTRKWVGEQADPRAGRGGGNGKSGAAGVYTKFSELEESFKEQGKSVQGEEFNAAVQKAVADNPNFDINS